MRVQQKGDNPMMNHTTGSDELLRNLNSVNDHLLSLAEPIDAESALRRESEIYDRARRLGFSIDIPTGNLLEKGMALAELEQKCRIRESGITYIGKSLTAIYNIPTQSSDITTEMIMDYTDEGELRRAYTRTADRKGNRWSIQIAPSDAMKLEKLFGLREMAKSDPVIAEHSQQRLAM